MIVLLIEEVATCWLHRYQTQLVADRVLGQGGSFKQMEHWDRRAEAAQRRYLRALESLARVRKLAGRGALQINIAGQQVNVAG